MLKIEKWRGEERREERERGEEQEEEAGDEQIRKE